jgi:hypothetical protein
VVVRVPGIIERILAVRSRKVLDPGQPLLINEIGIEAEAFDDKIGG